MQATVCIGLYNLHIQCIPPSSGRVTHGMSTVQPGAGQHCLNYVTSCLI